MSSIDACASGTMSDGDPFLGGYSLEGLLAPISDSETPVRGPADRIQHSAQNTMGLKKQGFYYKRIHHTPALCKAKGDKDVEHPSTLSRSPQLN